MEKAGNAIIVVGIFVIVAGIIVWFCGDKLRWFGRLPGDIRVEKEDFRFYMPVTTMILASILLSAILWLIRYLSK